MSASSKLPQRAQLTVARDPSRGGEWWWCIDRLVDEHDLGEIVVEGVETNGYAATMDAAIDAASNAAWLIGYERTGGDVSSGIELRLRGMSA